MIIGRDQQYKRREVLKIIISNSNQIYKNKRMLNNIEVKENSLPMGPANIAATVYVADLPKATSYLELAEFFEKNGGPCNIVIKR